MNYINVIKILIILAIISTVCILKFNPKMHTAIIVYDSNFQIVEQPEIETISEIELPTQVQKPVEKTMVEKTVQIEKQNKIEKPLINNQKKQVTSLKISQPVTTANIKLSKTPAQNISKIQSKKILEQEEQIAWNIWRSNLQNQIMKDVKLPPIPQGTVFKFSFDVDKYGKISNVQTWSTNNIFTPYSIQYIAPVIRSYQGHSILNFPEKSTRVLTHVKGGWKISSSAKFSSPSDYNDIEKVTK